MKCKVLVGILAFFLVFQCSPLVYADTLEASLDTPAAAVNPDPDAPRPGYLADNAGFMTNRVVSSNTPNTAANTELSFKAFLKDAEDWETSCSDILLINNNIYVAIAQSLVIFDGTSGVKLKETELVDSIGYTCRPIYTDGLVVVPLNGGILQAFTADELICVWVTEALSATDKGPHQNISTLIEKDGLLYCATAVADWETTYLGTFLCIDVKTGTVVLKEENTSSGYYWSGAVVVGDFVYIADNAGRLLSYHATEGWRTEKSCDLSTEIRSTLASDGSYLYAADSEGTLWRIALDEQGAMEPSGSVSFAAGSSSTPVISDGKLFIGGYTTDSLGILAVIDLSSFTLDRTVSAPANVQSAPLVVKQGADTYVYFTYNFEPGGLYCYRVGDAEASEIFVPEGEDANFCNASVVASGSGLLYYANDSGQLFVLHEGSGEANASGELPGEALSGGPGEALSGASILPLPAIVAIAMAVMALALGGVWLFRTRAQKGSRKA